MNLPKNIALIRKRWKENMEVFGKRFGMSRTNIGRYESGEYEASVSFCLKLSQLTGISVERLVLEALTVAEVPALPLGEGGERLTAAVPATSKRELPAGELGEFADLRNVAAAVRGLQLDMQQLRKLLEEGRNEGGSRQLDVIGALQTLIEYLEAGLDESDYMAEKSVLKNRLAAILDKAGKT